MDSEQIKHYMQGALEHAKKAHNINEVPVGAVIVKDNKIIAGAHNQLIHNSDPTGHAEIIAIREAAKINGNYIAPAKEGAWVYGYADIVRTTNEITFTTCKLLIDEKVIFTADGIFKILINKEGKSTSSTYPFYAD